MLFDTGLAPQAATDPEAVDGELAQHFNLSFGVDLTLQAQLGYKLSDVKYVVASHTHFDHTGGLYLFPHAQFYVGEGDIRRAGNSAADAIRALIILERARGDILEVSAPADA